MIMWVKGWRRTNITNITEFVATAVHNGRSSSPPQSYLEASWQVPDGMDSD